ncbi:MAG: phosphotransferase [Hyphomicrobiales bacterium]|nr:phosphotransferase [Hyphomicrobiales bacterium]
MATGKNTDRIKSLPLWEGEIDLEPLSGGITNVNYLVKDGDQQFVVRLGNDIIEHQIMRFNELAASKAAFATGLSPKVIHSEAGILVLEYIPSKPLDATQVRDPKNLPEIIALIKKCHTEIPQFLRGPALIFWVFHVLRDYGWTLRAAQSNHISKLAELSQAADRLEAVSGPHQMVFGHNDLLAANIIDDGQRLWLVDWDYAGFNSPLFDLGGLASNNEFDETQERYLLETYFDKPLDDGLWRRYQAMKCASLLRETMWSMVSEIHSAIEFDYGSYTQENLSRFEQAYDAFTQS